MTDLLPYFTQIIGHNSVNVHRLSTQLGTEIRLDEPFKYSKFQLDWGTHLHVMVDFVKYVKRRRGRTTVEAKNEEKSP